MSDPFGFGKVEHAKDPVVAYGVAFGRLQRGVAEFFQRFGKGFQQGLSGRDASTPEEQRERLLEIHSARKYAARIQHERRIGLAYVHAQAARVRRELGLEDRP